MIGEWTYTGDPQNSNKDAVRFLIGDTNDNRKKLSDQEIAYAIAAEGTTIRAAVRCLKVLSARYADLASYSAGGYSEAANQVSAEYARRAKDLEKELTFEAIPLALGTTDSDKEAMQTDSDVVQPRIAIGMDDNPSGTGTSSNLWQSGEQS